MANLQLPYYVGCRVFMDSNDQWETWIVYDDKGRTVESFTGNHAADQAMRYYERNNGK